MEVRRVLLSETFSYILSCLKSYHSACLEGWWTCRALEHLFRTPEYGCKKISRHERDSRITCKSRCRPIRIHKLLSSSNESSRRSGWCLWRGAMVENASQGRCTALDGPAGPTDTRTGPGSWTAALPRTQDQHPVRELTTPELLSGDRTHAVNVPWFRCHSIAHASGPLLRAQMNAFDFEFEV